MRHGIACLALCSALLAGCGKAPTRFLTGAFRIVSTGRVLALSELGQKEGPSAEAQELTLEVTGTFLANVEKSSLFLDGVQAYRLRPGRREPLFKSPRSWCLRRLSEAFFANRELTSEELWVSKVLMSYWQGRTPPSGEREELELDGRNRVRYERKGKTVERIWISREADRADLPELPNREAIPVEAQVQGSLVYSGTESFPARIEGRKTTKSRLGTRIVGKNALEVRIDQRSSPAPGHSIPSEVRYRLVDASRAEQNEAELQRKTLGSASLDELLARAEKPLPTQARNQVFLSLRALFYLQPGTCTPAVRKAKSPAARDLVAEALAGVGSPSAQTALMPLLRSGENFANRVALLVPITRFEPALEALLLDWAFGQNRTAAERDVAQLVVGSNVRRCLESNPDQARRLSGRLVEALRHTADESDILNLLYALGNAGNPELRELQLGYLESPSPVVRKGAVHSLRLLIDERAMARLKNRLRTEADPQVRREIEDVLAATTG